MASAASHKVTARILAIERSSLLKTLSSRVQSSSEKDLLQKMDAASRVTNMRIVGLPKMARRPR